MKLFLDANVLFTAAHNPDGKASFVIGLARHGIWKVVSSGLAVEEARRNLAMKFPESLARLGAILQRVGLVATVLEGDCPVELPGKDRSILLSAIGASCSHLLTGDLKDFGPFMNRPERTGGVIIQTVSQFLQASSG